MQKPHWLNKKVNLHDCRKVKELLRDLQLHTVCEESLCPNISECFHDGVATFMILGDICTRDCSFCSIKKGTPNSVDYTEPLRIQEAVKRLNLDYIVITSPTRDDLDNGGADMFCQTVRVIRQIDQSKKVEILIPDFLGKRNLLEKIAFSDVHVVAHNLETVPSLYMQVRKQANYQRSLGVLGLIKQMNNSVFTKSSLMLGMGEQKNEVLAVFDDLRKVNCDFLALGQYLPPSRKHYPLKQYISLDTFEFFKAEAFEKGFKHIKSSPYVRSSYQASTLRV